MNISRAASSFSSGMASRSGVKLEPRQQRQQEGLGAGQHGPGGVDRVAGVGCERHVAGVEEGEAEVVDALLGADRGDHLVHGVDLDAEALQVEVREGLAELGPAAVGGVLVRARVADRLAHRLDDVAEGGRVGVADAEADHVDPLLGLLLDLALELGEHVGRDRLEPLGGVGQRSRAPGAEGYEIGERERTQLRRRARPRRPARPSRSAAPRAPRRPRPRARRRPARR